MFIAILLIVTILIIVLNINTDVTLTVLLSLELYKSLNDFFSIFLEMFDRWPCLKYQYVQNERQNVNYYCVKFGFLLPINRYRNDTYKIWSLRIRFIIQTTKANEKFRNKLNGQIKRNQSNTSTWDEITLWRRKQKQKKINIRQIVSLNGNMLDPWT